MSVEKLLLALTVAFAALPAAHAQYQWRDANGRPVFSDLPPPPGVEPAAVLRAPARPQGAMQPPGPERQRTAAPSTASPAVAPATTPAVAPAATSAADREMAFRKRQLERADAQRKAEAQQARARRLAEACDEQRALVRTLESGARLTRINERGESEFIDDAQRAEQLDAARRNARDHCRT